jgi:eukaryotic translation initiation factor 2C
MVKQLLVAFNAKNGFLPEKLLVYRDGVSDGQFQTVLTEEVHAIKEECHGLGKEYDLPGGYQPTITFVILQKGHHTRFFPLSEAEKDVSGNCRAGTVIDSDVTNARNYDFYLFSHNGIQGTSRPVRYTVLYDDNNMAPDALQSLTYNMCFTYARCTRTVSVVPVAYYADLLAARGRAYLSGRKSAEGKKGRGGLSGGARPGGELSDALIGGFAGEPIVCQAISDRLFYI